MGIETATFIGDLQPANPGSSDLRSQGDDHLRLLKTVLQGTFPTASKAWYNPTTAAKSADFSVVAADMNKTFLVDTTGGVVNMTLPGLVAGDAGWECFLIKTTSGVNPVMVKPASGTLTSGAIPGLAAARRSIPGSKIRCLWSGTAWFVSRAEGVSGPVATAIEYHGATLPYGFEWPNGQTLASVATLYPEYNAVMGSGVTLDKRGRVGVPLDNLGGSAAGRLAGGAITGTAVGNFGGSDTINIAQTGLPNVTLSITGATSGQALPTDTAHAPNGYVATNFVSGNGGTVYFLGGGTAPPSGGTSAAGTITSGSTSSINTNVAQTATKILQPSMMVAQLLVVE